MESILKGDTPTVPDCSFAKALNFSRSGNPIVRISRDEMSKSVKRFDKPRPATAVKLLLCAKVLNEPKVSLILKSVWTLSSRVAEYINDIIKKILKSKYGLIIFQ